MRVRVMRGQVVVRELGSSGAIWTPAPAERTVKTHRGVVVAVGPDVDALVEVGSVVQYHFEHHKSGWTRPWPVDGIDATWLPARCVDAVWS